MKPYNRHHELNNTSDSSIPCNCGIRMFRYGCTQTYNEALEVKSNIARVGTFFLLFLSFFSKELAEGKARPLYSMIYNDFDLKAQRLQNTS